MVQPSGAPGAVDLSRLRAVLLREPAGASIEAGSDDGVRDVGREPTRQQVLVPAAVLFPIVLRPTGPTVLLTRRTEQLRDHPGQISFPGGRIDASDRSPEEAALREAMEEVGLNSRHIEIVGFLPEYRTVTGYQVTPVVGFVTPPFDLQPGASEVAEVFEVPLSFLLDSHNHQRHSRETPGGRRYFFAMPYGPYFIWGATAGMIVSLARAMAE